MSRNIFRTCKVRVEAEGQPYDLSIKQDLFIWWEGGLEIGHKISGRSCLVCDYAPVTAAKLREKA